MSRRVLAVSNPSVRVRHALVSLGVLGALAATSASCSDDVRIGEFAGDTSSGGQAPGSGGATSAGTTTGGSSVVPSATSSTGLDEAGAGGGAAGEGGADAGVGGAAPVGSGGAGGGSEAWGTPEEYLAACEVMVARIDELELELGCPTTGRTPSGLCESGFGTLSHACKLGMIPVVECYTASTEARDCFCEGALECSYYPACDALFDGPADCFEVSPPTFGGPRCGPGIGDCINGQYCDFADDLCGAGEAVGVCRPATSCSSPWTEVCGCDGQPYAELCDALLVGVDIDAAGSCR